MLSVQRRESNDESKSTVAGMIFTNADLRYVNRLDDKQGGDTIVTIERVKEAIAFNAELADESKMVVAHIRTNGLSLETDRWGRARGESRGFRQQPRGT